VQPARQHAGQSGFIARSSASALAVAAHELADLVRRLEGGPVSSLPTGCSGALSPVSGQEQDLLHACELAIAEVACEYRDALEWSLPESAQEVLMRQFQCTHRELRARQGVAHAHAPAAGCGAGRRRHAAFDADQAWGVTRGLGGQAIRGASGARDLAWYVARNEY